jgi:hypothetical protein
VDLLSARGQLAGQVGHVQLKAADARQKMVGNQGDFERSSGNG